MTKKDYIIGVLSFIIFILLFILVDTRLNVQNNIKSINLQIDKEKVLFVGDSITDQYELNRYYKYNDRIIVNSGISGYKTQDIISRFDNLIKQHQADKIFLLIGINDLGTSMKKDDIITNTIEIIEKTKKESPNSKIYYQSIYPINEDIRPFCKLKNKNVIYVNKKMKKYCEENNIEYIDTYSILVDEDGNLKKAYTEDGLHINDVGYEVITAFLKPYIEE